MEDGLILWALLVIPFLGGFCCILSSKGFTIRWIACATVWTMLATAFVSLWIVSIEGAIQAAHGWLFLDMLSSYHVVLLQVVFALSTLFAKSYFPAEIAHNAFNSALLPRYGMLWLSALGAMNLVFVSNNIGIMWVGVEATTLITAFLICIHVTPKSLEAMWKYLIMCSVGVALAFIGTMLVGAAGGNLKGSHSQSLLWTFLYENAGSLNPFFMKMAFLFLVVGYGTKAGFAPMHSWLPDAHSQAPAPVSALFSGFLLSTAFYCIMRYLPLVEMATGKTGWAMDILVFFGLFSIIIAAAFMVFQQDIKRLLAYSSIEHIGIMAVGLGLGGVGTFAALFHLLNHSMGKPLCFFSAGKLVQIYGTNSIYRIKNALKITPVWATGFFLSFLALIGMAPFAIFMSKFQILKAIIEKADYISLALFLFGCAVVFISALRYMLLILWGESEANIHPQKAYKKDIFLVAFPMLVLLILGLFMPEFLQNILQKAANIIQGY